MTKPLDWYRMKRTGGSIAGISEARRLPRLGKIRLGIRVSKGKKDQRCTHGPQELCNYCSFPKDVDYFVCPPEVQAKYGEKPKELKVFIPTEDREFFFPQSLRWYRGPRLICRGDGKSASRVDEKLGTMIEINCPCEHYGVDCFPRGSLMVMLPEVSMSGCYQIDTGSVTAMVSLNSSIDYLQNFLLGRIAFVPLILKREAQKIQTPDNKVVTKHLLALEFKGTIEDVAKLRMKDAIQSLVRPEREQAALPPAPTDVEEINGHGMTIEGEAVTFPDEQAPMDTANVGTPVDMPTFDREPGADEEEDPFPLADIPLEDTAPPPQKPPYQEPPPIEKPPAMAQGINGPGVATLDIARIESELMSSTSKEFLNARWQELVVKNKSLSAMQKVDLQKVYMTAQKRIKK